MSPIFYEEQKFTQWWLWLLLGVLAFIPLYGIYKQIVLGGEFGSQPMSDLGLMVFGLLVFALLYFFWSIKLTTEIDQSEIKMSFFPLTKKSVGWDEIQSIEVVSYGFVGYGIRYGFKYGTIYNIKGNKGIAIVLKNGDRFLIGTQKPKEIQAFIDLQN